MRRRFDFDTQLYKCWLCVSRSLHGRWRGCLDSYLSPAERRHRAVLALIIWEEGLSIRHPSRMILVFPGLSKAPRIMSCKETA